MAANIGAGAHHVKAPYLLMRRLDRNCSFAAKTHLLYSCKADGDSCLQKKVGGYT